MTATQGMSPKIINRAYIDKSYRTVGFVEIHHVEIKQFLHDGRGTITWLYTHAQHTKYLNRTISNKKIESVI